MTTQTDTQRQIAKAKRQKWEQALWTQIVQLRLPRPLAECQGDDTHFLPGRDYHCDLLWPGRRLIVEADGLDWAGGWRGHNAPPQYEKDCERDAEAAIAGFTTLRFTPWLIENGYAVQAIERWIANTNPATRGALQEERERLAGIARSWHPCWGADPGYAAVCASVAAAILEG